MDDSISGTKELDDKLSKEIDRLSALKDSLQRSEQLKTNMIKTLDAFDERLEKLQNTIKPVCDETESLQRKHENISMTLTSLDNVLTFYDSTAAVELVIKEQPSNVGIDNYLTKMNDLQKAVKFFTDNNPGSKEMSNVQSLYDAGKDSLEREFRTVLTRHSKPVNPVVVLDLLQARDEEEIAVTPAPIDHLPSKVHQDLSQIGQWLQQCDSMDYTQVYLSTRSNILKRSLQGLKDHLKSRSKDSANVSFSPALTPKPRQESSKKGHKTKEFMKKAPGNLMKSSLAQLHAAGRRWAGPTSSDYKEETSEVDIDIYIHGVSALVVLMQSEFQLMEGIIHNKHKKKVFERIVLESIQMLIKEGEQIGVNVRKSTERSDFSGVLLIFPVVKHLRNIRPEVDQILDGVSTTTKTLFPGLITSLDEIGFYALENFVDYVKNDPEKVSNMPKDGTVHELTSNTIIFLEQMIEFSSTAGAMLMSRGSGSSRATTEINRKVAEYITRVLQTLGLNLNNKAGTYGDSTLRSIFLLNNYNYILKSLKRTELLTIAKMTNKDLDAHYEDIIMEQKRLYSQSWSRVLHYIRDTRQGDVSLMESGKLKDKDKQLIKDKFNGFNKEMEELRRVQNQYTIPDPELQDSLTKDNLDFIIPAYQNFIEKYRLVNFTKNPDKYLKYSVSDVKRFITHFFDSLA